VGSAAGWGTASSTRLNDFKSSQVNPFLVSNPSYSIRSNLDLTPLQANKDVWTWSPPTLSCREPRSHGLLQHRRRLKDPIDLVGTVTAVLEEVGGVR
jgi:hypothetical protein